MGGDVCNQKHCACDLILTYKLLRNAVVCVSAIKCGNISIPHPHMLKTEIPFTDKQLSRRLRNFEFFNLFETCPFRFSLQSIEVKDLSESSSSDSSSSEEDSNSYDSYTEPSEYSGSENNYHD